MKRPVFEFRHAWTLALLGGLLASVGGAFLGVEVGATLKERALLEAERALIEPPRLLFEAVRHTQAHRRLAGEVLGGNSALEPQRLVRQQELDAAIAHLAAVLDRTELYASARVDWAGVDKRWREIAAAVSARRLSASQSDLEHGVLIQAQLDVHDRLGLDGIEYGHQWEMELWKRTPALVEQLELAQGRSDPALQARVGDWAEALAPALRAKAPPEVRTAFELALRQRLDPAGADADPTHASQAAMLAAVLEADIRWQQQRLAQRVEDSRQRLQEVMIVASGLVLLLLLGYLGVLRLHRGQGGQKRDAAAAEILVRERTPAVLGQRLLAALRRRARAAPPTDAGTARGSSSAPSGKAPAHSEDESRSTN